MIEPQVLCPDELQRNWQYLQKGNAIHQKHTTLALQHLVQLIMPFARTSSILASQPEHVAELEWIPDKNCFAGGWLDAPGRPVRIGLDCHQLRMVVFGAPHEELASFHLVGETIDSVCQWLGKTLRNLQVDLGILVPDLPYHLPHHHWVEGVPFAKADFARMGSICRLRSNIHHMLKHILIQCGHPYPIRVCPQRFDTWTVLIPGLRHLEDTVKFIRLGLGIPDQWVDQYYFYVLPANPLPAFPMSIHFLPLLEGGGRWIDATAIRAVLSVDQIYGESNARDQAEKVWSFFRSALAVCAEWPDSKESWR
jgi:hypothetical protein